MKDEWIEMKVSPSASEIKVFILWKLQLITYLVSRKQSESNEWKNNPWNLRLLRNLNFIEENQLYDSKHQWHWIESLIFLWIFSHTMFNLQILSLHSFIEQTIHKFSFCITAQRKFNKTKSNKMINNARKIENNLNKRLQQYLTIEKPIFTPWTIAMKEY